MRRTNLFNHIWENARFVEGWVCVQGGLDSWKIQTSVYDCMFQPMTDENLSRCSEVVKSSPKFDCGSSSHLWRRFNHSLHRLSPRGSNHSLYNRNKTISSSTKATLLSVLLSLQSPCIPTSTASHSLYSTTLISLEDGLALDFNQTKF